MESTLSVQPLPTIAAVATPAGRGAVVLIRVSGSDAISIVDSVWKGRSLKKAATHTAHLGYIVDLNNVEAEPIDQVLATVFRAPGTFTGEDMVEIGLHGSPLIAGMVLDVLIKAGARLAEPGEFSMRAVTNGRMSLMAAEAAADLIASSSAAGRRIAMTQMRGGVERKLESMQKQLLELAALLELELDFSEEDVEFASRAKLIELAYSIRKHLEKLRNSYRSGSAIKNGIPIAIVGPTNSGKSSLLNALVDEERSIVSDIHGTTRDVVEDSIVIGDYMFRFMDTAGLRDTDDPIEQIGIQRSRRTLDKAAIILLVSDVREPLPIDLLREIEASKSPDAKVLILRNKTDVYTESNYDWSVCGDEFIKISAHTGAGLDELKARLLDWVRADEALMQDVLLTNERHYQCVAEALSGLSDVISQLEAADPLTIVSPDITAQSVRTVISSLSAIIGTSLQSPAVLQHIFSNFCVGK